MPGALPHLLFLLDILQTKGLFALESDALKAYPKCEPSECHAFEGRMAWALAKAVKATLVRMTALMTCSPGCTDVLSIADIPVAISIKA